IRRSSRRLPAEPGSPLAGSPGKAASLTEEVSPGSANEGAMPHFERYYTVEEANALLPELRAVLATIRQARDQLADSWHQAEPVIRAASTNGGGQEAAGYLAARF